MTTIQQLSSAPETIGPKPNTNYLKSAIASLYGDEDDFILLGLTGRTGSGCSTAASILQTAKSEIKHSLFSGDSPASNNDRKEKIIARHFAATWTPFLLIQVRSLITSFLLDYDVELTANKLDHLMPDLQTKTAFKDLLHDLKNQYDQINASPSQISPSEYYTKTLPAKCEAIRTLLGESRFVKLYQEVGRNIRLSGNPYEKLLVEGKFFTLAERINSVVKKIHQYQQHRNEKTFIVIDAIRSPLEAIYFQERYSSFFLVAVSAPETDRVKRLHQLRYSEDDIASLDKTEYTARDLDEHDFYSVQDIQACLQRADLYISNPDVSSEVNKFQYLANQLIRFISLIRHPGIVTPSAVERCMQMAYTAKLNSGCISRQVGAVVTDQNYSVRAVGWNDAPHGQVPCNLRNRDDLLGGHDSTAYSEYERTNGAYLAHFRTSSIRFRQIPETGRNNSFCFKSEYNAFKDGERNQVHTRSLHAEENAFLQVSKYGLAAIEGGILFTTASPCELCAKKAYQIGITDIVYIDPYPGIAVTHILMGGTKNPKLSLFSGAIGRAFHKFYTPIVAYKDELSALVS
jgi:deoxycytidylate deaminase/dephospho-CoA kinase